MKEKGFTLKTARNRRYPVKTIMHADKRDDMALLANTPTQVESLQHSLEQAAAGIGLHVKTDKTKYMYFNKIGDISTLKGGSLKLVDKFKYLGSSVSSMNMTSIYDERRHRLLPIDYRLYGSHARD